MIAVDDRFRYPLPLTCPASLSGAARLAGGKVWFDRVALLTRGQTLSAAQVVPLSALPDTVRLALTRPRAAVAGVGMERPSIMGILNITPDSFSDGGAHFDPADAVASARAMAAAGARFLDVGGESTRPGAREVPVAEEVARIRPVLTGICATLGPDGPCISIDTRKAAVARAAVEAGAGLINDVSAMGFDPQMPGMIRDAGLPVCLMHAQGSPETMQSNPQYSDVLLDVYDALETYRDQGLALGLSPDAIVLDPGIGFGKTLAHNLTLLRSLALFHALGCPLLLGASRKRFIGTIGHAEQAADRMPGSVAVALQGAAQGVQVLRVHDVDATAQALNLWSAMIG